MSLEVRPVQTKRDRRAFLDLPYRLYATEKRWVPPLRIERKEHLDPQKNPFFEHAEVQFFLAERDGRVVGRISAHVDRNLNAFFKHGKAQEFVARRDGRVIGRITAQFDESFNRYHDNRWGMFGFLEFEDDPDVVPAMLEAA